MKQKRTYVTLLLVLAILGLGIAYAALNAQNLTVTTGVTTTVSGTMDVEITSVTLDKQDKGTASAGDGLAATLNVTGLKAANDEVTATVTFTNNQAGVPADISKVSVKKANGDDWVNTEWLEITASDVTPVEEGATNVESGKTATATIKVKLLKTPGTTADEANATISGLVVSYEAEAVNQ